MKRVSIAVLVLACGCNAFVGRYGPAFYEGTKSAYFERIADEGEGSAANDPGFSVLLGPDEQVRASADGGECLGYPTVFRFAWLSDVQLRQREVKLFSDGVSRKLDKVITNFEHNGMQDEFSWAAFLLQIQALNRVVLDAARSDPKSVPLFMIHTGDAIDSGSVQEAYQFQYIANMSRIPWFNVLGNHDTAIFGNYEKRLTYSLDASVEFYPVGRRGFLGMHRPAKSSSFGSGLLPVSPLANDQVSLAGAIRLPDGHLSDPVVPASDCHGFDLLVEPAESALQADPACCPEGQPCPGPTLTRGEVAALGCSRAPGRYAFTVERGGRKFRIVVIDTVKKTGWGAEEEFNGCDQRWLQETLKVATEPTILLFAHHRPSKNIDQVVIASGKADRVVYFSGHTHSHAFVPASASRPYPELNTGSIIEYPQVGRMVEVRAGGDRVCVVTRAMWSSYQGTTPGDLRPDPAQRPELERYLKATCEPDPAGQRVPLAAAAKCSRYGAMIDFLDGRTGVFAKPQPFEAWWKAANVAVAIGTRRAQ